MSKTHELSLCMFWFHMTRELELEAALSTTTFWRQTENFQLCKQHRGTVTI